MQMWIFFNLMYSMCLLRTRLHSLKTSLYVCFSVAITACFFTLAKVISLLITIPHRGGHPGEF